MNGTEDLNIISGLVRQNAHLLHSNLDTLNFVVSILGFVIRTLSVLYTNHGGIPNTCITESQASENTCLDLCLSIGIFKYRRMVSSAVEVMKYISLVHLRSIRYEIISKIHGIIY
jgi:hypothetical protein